MDFSALTLFVEIVEAGNLSNAAKNLKISRSAASYRLKALEKSLGVQLLRRTTRCIDTTEIGMRFYEHARTILTELAAAQAVVSSLGASLQGSVRLSVPTGLGQAMLAPLLIEYKRQNPAVTLEVLFENRIFNLLEDEVDVAIRIISKPPESLIATDLGPVDWLVCGTPDYLKRKGRPRTLDDLANHDFACSAAVGKKLKIHARRGQERRALLVNPLLRSENFQFLKDAILSGAGLGILPYYQIRDELAAGSIVSLFGQYQFSVFGTRAFMLSVANRYQTMAIHSLISFLKLHVRPRLSAVSEEFAERMASR